MRFMVSWVAAVFGMLAFSASPAQSEGREFPASGRIVSCTNVVNEKGGAVSSVVRGQEVGVACSETSHNAVDVRVILEFEPTPGEKPTGFRAVLATRQTVEDGKVIVRVPDLPDIADHTMNVKVFVTDESGTRSCDAGRVKVY